MSLLQLQLLHVRCHTLFRASLLTSNRALLYIY
jgi:hypothetical protein